VILTESDDELLVGDFASYREACLAAARRADSPESQLRIYDQDGRELGHLGA